MVRAAAAQRPLQLVYSPKYSPKAWPPTHRFPMGKFAALRRALDDGAVLRGVPHAYHVPDHLDDEEFERTHDAEYYRAFKQQRLAPDLERRIGFREHTRHPDVIERTRLECAGTVLAAHLALEHGVACHLAGGTHHAHADAGSGFCILNDLAIAASYARRRLGVSRVLVVDLDVHQGDGTARLLADDAGAFTLSVHCADNFPLRKAASDLDVPLPAGCGDAAYEAALAPALVGVLDSFRPQLVLYDAGVDVWEGDALGGLALSHAGIYKRDSYVFRECAKRHVSVASVIGGGYDRDVAALGRRHSLMVRAAARVAFGGRGAK